MSALALGNSELDRQLALARKAGLPTTWQELKATIPPAKPQDNAAPLYAQVMHAYRSKTSSHPNFDVLNRALLWNDDKSNLLAAQRAVDSQSRNYQILESATSRSRCVYSRDWKYPNNIIFEEPHYMWGMSKALALRASLSARKGNFQAAELDCQRMFKIGNHLMDEALPIDVHMADMIYFDGFREIASLHGRFSGQGHFRAAYAKALASLPPVDPRRLYRLVLVSIRSLISESQTKDGRADLGLKESDLPEAARTLPPKPPGDADAKVIQGVRQFIQAFRLPQKERDRKIKQAKDLVWVGLAAYPIAVHVYPILEFSDDGGGGYIDYLKERRVQLKALGRALGPHGFDDSIRTSDLADPMTGQPVTYHKTAKAIRISGSSKDQDLVVPLIPVAATQSQTRPATGRTPVSPF